MMVAHVRELQGRHVLFILFGFFGTMLAVNALFVYFALSTFTGVESDAYDTGLHYNTRIDDGDRQAALGWSHKVALGPDGGVTVSMSDRAGAPLAGLLLTGEIGRPVADNFTRTLSFRETGTGVYLAPASSLQPGNWIVSLQAVRAGARGSETAYRIKERLWFRPRP